LSNEPRPRSDTGTPVGRRLLDIEWLPGPGGAIDLGLAGPIVARLVAIDDDGEAEFEFRNTGTSTVLLEEYGAVRDDGTASQLEIPCGFPLEPGATYPFQVPLAFLDGSSHGRMTALVLHVGPGGDDEPLPNLICKVQGWDQDGPARSEARAPEPAELRSKTRPTHWRRPSRESLIAWLVAVVLALGIILWRILRSAY
jgi:hypothetical protein